MLQLNGQKLTLQQIVDVAEGREEVVLDGDARVRVEQARRVVPVSYTHLTLPTICSV